MVLVATVCFIVFMCLWIAGGGYVASRDAAFNFRAFGGYTILPWLCVAILGYLVLTGATVVVHDVR